MEGDNFFLYFDSNAEVENNFHDSLHPSCWPFCLISLDGINKKTIFSKKKVIIAELVTVMYGAGNRETEI